MILFPHFYEILDISALARQISVPAGGDLRNYGGNIEKNLNNAIIRSDEKRFLTRYMCEGALIPIFMRGDDLNNGRRSDSRAIPVEERSCDS
jgi:hypothetical protein